jgi:uncharacterized protein (DUF111 family)
MSDGRFAILDPAAGISGDMLLGALVSAGASPAWLGSLPARLGFPQVRIDIETVDRCGVSATKVNVVMPGGAQEHPAPAYEHQEHRPQIGQAAHSHHHDISPDHDSDHDAPHRRIGELIPLIEKADLSCWVRDRAIRAFQLLGDAEGRVHGMPAAEVPLHEVGALRAARRDPGL